MSYILIIEPDLMLAKTVSSYLKSKGLRVKTCADPAEAMSLADEKKPRALVTELQLPKYSAIEFLYEFRSYQDWESIPVVLYGIIPVEQVGIDGPTWKQLGVLSYIYKPKMKLESLANLLKSAIAKK